MTCGGFSVRGRHLCEDFGLCVSAQPGLSAPVQKTARVDIPFSHGTLDFSALNGEVYYQDRELSFSFDVLADGPEDLEAQLAAVASWLSPVCGDELVDDDRPDVYFRASAPSLSVSRDETGLAASVEASFSVYPFALARTDSEARITKGSNPVVNRGDMRARLTVEPEGTVTITVGNLKQTFNGRAVANLYLAPGENAVEVVGGSALITWREGYL